MIEGMDINPQMAYEFIKLLKELNIEYYVAPYEADAQLAYLSKIGLVDCVITEDSDLLAFGCKRILYKLDAETDVGNEILYDEAEKHHKSCCPDKTTSNSKVPVKRKLRKLESNEVNQYKKKGEEISYITGKKIKIINNLLFISYI